MRRHPAHRVVPSLTDAEVRAIAEGEIVVRDRSFGVGLARRANAALMRWREQGMLREAGIGREARATSFRTDRMMWVDMDHPDFSEALHLFDGLRTILAQDLRVSLQRFTVQAACYEQGASYGRHRDALTGDPNRVITAIWYVNPGWQDAWGGELIAHLDRGSRAVSPREDRLVIFRSESVLHEVLPAYAPRFALTAWYRGAEALPLLPDPSVHTA